MAHRFCDFNVYGPRQNSGGNYAAVIPRFIRACATKKPLTIYGDGKQTRDFIYVSDVVEANLAAMTTTHENAFGKAYNIGSGKETSVSELATTISRLSRSITFMISAPALREPHRSVADINAARRILDWQPKVSLAEGIKLTLHTYTRVQEEY